MIERLIHPRNLADVRYVCAIREAVGFSCWFLASFRFGVWIMML